VAKEYKELDELTGTGTTGHEWDGIKELDTPLPRWWLWTFYITIVWGIVYTVFYPAWPLVTTATSGVLGYSTRMQLAETIKEHEASQAGMVEKIAAADFAQIASDSALDDFAQAGGAAIFRTWCAQCHGAGGAGAKGYPNLRDDDWLWGGKQEDIQQTVTHGIRSADDDDTRVSEMPAFGADEILTDTQIGAVADHVLSLSGQGAGNAEGAEIFAENCAACHGEAGQGEQSLGAPNLSDGIWLYGGDRVTVMQTIRNSRAGVMPAWNSRLSDAEIKQVTHYVYSRAAGK